MVCCSISIIFYWFNFWYIYIFFDFFLWRANRASFLEDIQYKHVRIGTACWSTARLHVDPSVKICASLSTFENLQMRNLSLRLKDRTDRLHVCRCIVVHVDCHRHRRHPLQHFYFAWISTGLVFRGSNLAVDQTPCVFRSPVFPLGFFRAHSGQNFNHAAFCAQS